MRNGNNGVSGHLRHPQEHDQVRLDQLAHGRRQLTLKRSSKNQSSTPKLAKSQVKTGHEAELEKLVKSGDEILVFMIASDCPVKCRVLDFDKYSIKLEFGLGDERPYFRWVFKSAIAGFGAESKDEGGE